MDAHVTRRWTDLYDPRLGGLRMKTLAVDPTSGTIEVGTCGNGTYRVVPLNPARSDSPGESAPAGRGQGCR